MRTPEPLPRPLSRASAFATADAVRLGVHHSRLRIGGLTAPFHGARTVGGVQSLRARVEAYATRMPPSQFFSHASAAAVLGIPLPARFERSNRVDVGVRRGDALPVARGVARHVFDPDHLGLCTRVGLRITSPVTTWRSLGSVLELDDLIAATDFLLTGEAPIGGSAPLCTRAELELELRRSGGFRGVVRLRAALDAAREGSVSRRETLTRLVIVRAGLPEPVPNHPVLDEHGRREAVIDLAYPDHLVGIEYQSDFHVDPARYRADLARLERLADRGWLMIQVTAADLASPQAQRTLARRIAARLAAR